MLLEQELIFQYCGLMNAKGQPVYMTIYVEAIVLKAFAHVV